ncbi:Magnetic particle membrane specific GTPase P16 [Rhodospirillaceae bacterium LM-1]|nr:Magnetic particle membrane specific GTPase P16 [Rhodospirillaceae bacterium LM-1]
MSNVKSKTAAASSIETPKSIESAVAVGRETLEQVVKASADAANKGYEKAVAMTKENVEAAVKAGASVFKNYEEAMSFNKENIEAFVRSGSIFAKGWQEATKSVFALTQEAFEESVVASKAILGAKSMKEAVDLQTGFVKTSFDKVVAEGGKISETSFKLAEEAFGPINERVNETVSKLMKPIAA